MNKEEAKEEALEEALERIASAERELELAKAALSEAKKPAALSEAKKPEEQWEPKGGGFYLNYRNDVDEGHSVLDAIRAGREFGTRQSAERASQVFTFFSRLYKLAEELNPSGKACWGSNYGVFWDSTSDKWLIDRASCGSLHGLFETRGAVIKATEIMNRDKWERPY
jgi:hypothetical protein